MQPSQYKGLTNNEDSCVQDCIKKLLDEHIQHPFGILRESGAAAELRSLLAQQQCFGMTTPGFKKFPERVAACRFNRSGVTTAVRRVQMEIEVGLSGHGFGQTTFIDTGVFASTKVLDIAVLSTNLTLYCHPNGAGDVVQKVELGSVSAAIEVKASPSSLLEQRGHYVKDVWALLELAAKGIDGYFVLLDKTSALYGAPACVTRAGVAMVWEQRHPQDIVLRRKGQDDLCFSSLQAVGLKVSPTPPEKPYVQIWIIEASSNGFTPKRLFASAI